MDKVSGALLKQLAAGDKPKSISSPNLDMSVGRKTLEGIGGADDDEDAEEREGMGGVRLPDPMALFGGANASVEEGATSAIGSTVSRYAKKVILDQTQIMRNKPQRERCGFIVYCQPGMFNILTMEKKDS